MKNDMFCCGEQVISFYKDDDGVYYRCMRCNRTGKREDFLGIYNEELYEGYNEKEMKFELLFEDLKKSNPGFLERVYRNWVREKRVKNAPSVELKGSFGSLVEFGKKD